MKENLSLGELRELLGAESLENLSQDKLMELFKLLPRLKEEEAIGVLASLRNKDELSLGILRRLKVLCEEALIKGEDTATIRSYKKALDALEFMIKDGIASFEDTEYCRNEIITIARSLKKANYIEYSEGLIKAMGAPRALLYLIGAGLIR